MRFRALAEAVHNVFRHIDVSQNVAMPVLVLTNPNYHNLAPPIMVIGGDQDPSDPKPRCDPDPSGHFKSPLCTNPDGTTKKTVSN